MEASINVDPFGSPGPLASAPPRPRKVAIFRMYMFAIVLAPKAADAMERESPKLRSRVTGLFARRETLSKSLVSPSGFTRPVALEFQVAETPVELIDV